jgi:hypothetical protein
VNKRAQIGLFVGVAILGVAIGTAVHFATREQSMPAIPAASAAPALMGAKLPTWMPGRNPSNSGAGKVIVVNFWRPGVLHAARRFRSSSSFRPSTRRKVCRSSASQSIRPTRSVPTQRR